MEFINKNKYKVSLAFPLFNVFIYFIQTEHMTYLLKFLDYRCWLAEIKDSVWNAVMGIILDSYIFSWKNTDHLDIFPHSPKRYCSSY